MNRKIQLTALAVFTMAISVFAQSAPKPWAELKNFHHFMSASFHPAEEGNLVPLKEKADSMLVAAKQWQATAIPAEYKIAETKTALQKLVKQCAAIKKAVHKKATDEELKKQIAAAHDIFHTIVKECKKEEEKK